MSPHPQRAAGSTHTISLDKEQRKEAATENRRKKQRHSNRNEPELGFYYSNKEIVKRRRSRYLGFP